MSVVASINYTFEDSKGARSTTKVRVPNDFNLDGIIEFAQAVGQALVDLSLARLIKATVCVGIDLSVAVLRATANQLSDIGRKAFFKLRDAASNFAKFLNIPSLDEPALTGPNSDDLILTALPIATLETAAASGLDAGGTNAFLTDNRGTRMTELVLAQERFRKRR